MYLTDGITTESPDVQLVRLAQHGFEPAIEAICERYRERLLQYMNNRVNNPEIAEDLVQDTLLTIIQRIDSLRQPDALRCWVYRIAYSTYVDYLRQLKCRPVTSLDQMLKQVNLESDLSHFEGEMERLPVSLALERAANTLTPTARQVIVLNIVLGYSQSEVAWKLDISVEAAKKRIQRAKAQLKRCYVGELRNSLER